MKTTLRRFLSSAIAVLLTLAAAATSTAAQVMADDTMNPVEMLYVIKVTPTLVYMDAGETAGVGVGQSYILLAEREGKDKFNGVAEVRVIACTRNSVSLKYSRLKWARRSRCCSERSPWSTGK